MTKWQRVWRVVSGLLMVLEGVLLIELKEQGLLFISAILSLSLVVAGLRALVYYFTMARHMVDGKIILFFGMILLDLGLFATTLLDSSAIYIILYLLAIHSLSGALDVLRALEARRLKAPSWRIQLAEGIANLLIVLACIVFSRSLRMTVYLFSAGIIYRACLRILSAFRRSAIVYIA